MAAVSLSPNPPVSIYRNSHFIILRCFKCCRNKIKVCSNNHQFLFLSNVTVNIPRKMRKYRCRPPSIMLLYWYCHFYLGELSVFRLWAELVIVRVWIGVNFDDNIFVSVTGLWLIQRERHSCSFWSNKGFPLTHTSHVQACFIVAELVLY